MTTEARGELKIEIQTPETLAKMAAEADAITNETVGTPSTKIDRQKPVKKGKLLKVAEAVGEMVGTYQAYRDRHKPSLQAVVTTAKKTEATNTEISANEAERTADLIADFVGAFDFEKWKKMPFEDKELLFGKNDFPNFDFIPDVKQRGVVENEYKFIKNRKTLNEGVPVSADKKSEIGKEADLMEAEMAEKKAQKIAVRLQHNGSVKPVEFTGALPVYKDGEEFLRDLRHNLDIGEDFFKTALMEGAVSGLIKMMAKGIQLEGVTITDTEGLRTEIIEENGSNYIRVSGEVEVLKNLPFKQKLRTKVGILFVLRVTPEKKLKPTENVAVSSENKIINDQIRKQNATFQLRRFLEDTDENIISAVNALPGFQARGLEVKDLETELKNGVLEVEIHGKKYQNK